MKFCFAIIYEGVYNMAYVCKNCGTQLNEHFKFCAECGQPQHFGIMDDPKTAFKKNWYKKWWIWVIPALVIVVLATANLGGGINTRHTLSGTYYKVVNGEVYNRTYYRFKDDNTFINSVGGLTVEGTYTIKNDKVIFYLAKSSWELTISSDGNIIRNGADDVYKKQ